MDKMKPNLPIRYGGSMCDDREYKAVMKSVKESIKSGGWQQGKEGDLLEKEAADFLGVKYGILTASGSCAGLLALSALELPKGSEVIISACTFPTIFNIILQCGFVPVVVDAKIGTYGFDIDEVEDAITENTGAIIAIHPVGNPVDMPALMKMVSKYEKKIYVIEDNCDGWGSEIGNKKVGSFGDVSITSFHAAHIVSMGVGGGVFTNSKEIAKNVRMYRDWGRQANTTEPNKYEMLPKDYNPRFIYEKIGYNFQILDLQAAMGRVQLTRANEIKKLRRANFDYLVKHLSKHKELIMPKTVKGADVCWFALPLSTQGHRGHLVAHLEKNGIETRSMFAGNITKHPAYKGSKFTKMNLRESDYILRQSFWIGVHPRMTQADREYVVKVFDDYYK
jgi:CDP-4-dehydro-6-deoxyglucose reductase, E1